MKRLLAALATLSLAASVPAIPTPAERCQSAGYDTALHMLQPDGVSRAWTCIAYPAADLSTPFRSAYLKDL